MSMYRQLWLAVIVSMLIALAGSLLASSLSARNYLSEQLSIKNADNAGALALSLSLSEPDEVEVELAVSALFDSGHYELIRVTDPRGKVLVERRMMGLDNYGAPEWFVRLLPIGATPGQAQINSGWKQFGTIHLVSHSRFAYDSLWRNVWELTVALFLATLVGGYLGTLILRRLRLPLRAVIEQAKAITERRFVTIDEPQVPELHQLATAMNATVVRLKNMFEEEAARLDSVRREANCDSLTGLSNRSHFLARLHEALEAEDSHGVGLILVRISDLAGINRRLGRAATDDLLRRVASAIRAAGEAPECLAARLNGADFALLLMLPSDTRLLAERLLPALVQEAAAFVGDAPAACVGFGAFARGTELSTVLSQVDAALASAETEGGNAVREAGGAGAEDIPKSAEEWSRLIRRALDRRWLKLISFPVADFGQRLIHRECPLRLMLDDHGEWLPAGRFLPVAERLKLTSRLDLAAVTLGLNELASNPAINGLAVNLSASSLQDRSFRGELGSVLGRFQNVARRLWIEVAEVGAMKYFEEFRLLCKELKAAGCKVGVEHFGREFSQIGQLHGLGLDYLKVDACFVRGLEANPGNQAFLKGLCAIVHGIGILVIAEGAASEAELAALSDIGFDGATGPAVREPAA